MVPSDSDDDLPLTRANSVHDKVPDDKIFPIKVVEGEAKTRFEYLLPQGRTLPYEVELNGYTFVFSKSLEVEIVGGGWKKEHSKKFIVFTREANNMENEVNVESGNGSKNVEIEPPPSTSSGNGNIFLSAPILSDEELSQLNKLLGDIDDDGNNVCLVCCFSNPNILVVSQHILDSHSNWKDIVLEQPQAEASGTQSVFINQDWKSNLINNFDDLIIRSCSELTRNAWHSKIELKEKDKFKKVRREIIQSLEDYLLKIHDTNSLPTEEKLKEIIERTLISGYPFMFGQGAGTAAECDGLNHGYGLGGIHGVVHLPKQMRVELDKQQRRKRRTEIDLEKLDDLEAEESLAKKGRKPMKFGVNNNKFWSNCSEAQLANINESANISAAEEREIIYARNRQGICVQIRNSGKLIDRVVRGFWMDPIHVKKHFYHLTNTSEDLRQRIQNNWNAELSKMLRYIEKKDVKGKYMKLIQDSEDKCDLEYEGARTYKEIVVIRSLVSILDKSGHGRAFICFDGEEIATTGPFLLAKEHQR